MQIPGAQEILKISREGKVTEVVQNRRVPGTVIKNIFSNGDWLVEVKDEDGVSHMEVWVRGDSEKVKVWESSPKGNPVSYKGGVVRYDNWTLTLPSDDQILKVFMLGSESRIVALTTDYDIYEWDLLALDEELARLGFSRAKTSN